MTETRKKAASATMTASTQEKSSSVYERLCEKIDIQPIANSVEINTFSDPKNMADAPFGERLTAAVNVFLEMVGKTGTVIDRIDRNLLDQYISQIDGTISAQLDEILHNKTFQEIESAWRSLKFLVDRTDFRANIKIEMLNVSKEDLMDDFEEAPDTTQSGLYKHIYTQEYDTPGGEPVSTIVSNFQFGRSARDISLLSEIAKVSAAAHCPFLGGVGADFFGKESMNEVVSVHDLRSYMDRSEFLRWKSFRESEDARYIGLILPRFLLRMPYGSDSNPTREFNYEENVHGEDSDRYLWGNATFAFAANMARSFKDNGWCVQVRGPQSGGKVENLPIHTYDLGRGKQAKIPTEVLIPETREFEFAELGFVPLSYYKNSDFACFFSASSAQKPAEYDRPEATANSRINARLPYIFLVSRIAHYLKVLQRENIGSNKPRQFLEEELHTWAQTLVTEMKDPDPELISTHPLRKAEVKVHEIAENPGFYRVALTVMPHFQIEGIDVRLSLVAQMPKEKSK
jgi:type VI secretion system protein ImpC